MSSRFFFFQRDAVGLEKFNLVAILFPFQIRSRDASLTSNEILKAKLLPVFLAFNENVKYFFRSRIVKYNTMR